MQEREYQEDQENQVNESRKHLQTLEEPANKLTLSMKKHTNVNFWEQLQNGDMGTQQQKVLTTKNYLMSGSRKNK